MDAAAEKYGYLSDDEFVDHILTQETLYRRAPIDIEIAISKGGCVLDDFLRRAACK